MLTIDKLRNWGANVDEGLSRCMGMEEFYLKLVGMAINDDQLSALEKALADKDLEAAFEVCHALKGMYGNLSLSPVYDPLCEMTELLRAKKDVDYSVLLASIKAAKAGLDELAK